MKKLFILILLSSFCYNSIAQNNFDYRTSIGLQGHFGIDYGTLIGISAKRFMTKHGVLEARFQYGSNTKLIGLEYQYHGKIPVQGLKWYAGIGPTYVVSRGSFTDWNGINYETSKSIDFGPTIGLDQKLNKLPINLSAGWRPSFLFSSTFNVFHPAQFDIAFRYVIN